MRALIGSSVAGLLVMGGLTVLGAPAWVAVPAGLWIGWRLYLERG